MLLISHNSIVGLYMVGPCEVVVLPLRNHRGDKSQSSSDTCPAVASSIASSQEGSGGCGGGDVIVAVDGGQILNYQYLL